MADADGESPAAAVGGAAATTSPQDLAKEFNLMPKLMPHLDRHLIFPLLEFMAAEKIVPPEEIQKQTYDLLKPTNMTEFVVSIWKQINNSEDAPAEFAKKQQTVAQELSTLEKESSKILELLEDKEVISALRQDKMQNLTYLKDNHGVTVEMVNSLLKFGQCQYSRGDYASASDLLQYFRILSTDNDKVATATWGKLACEILLNEWEGAMEEIQKVKESIESKLFNNPVAQLQHRTWLIHWALFPLFNHEGARDTITDLLFSPSFINTIQTSCPWIVRYLAAAVITNRARGNISNRNSAVQQKQFKELVRVVKQEQYEYSDPVTEFVAALHIDYDFEEAQRKLGEAEIVLKSDFFLLATADQFVDSARHLISEAYCRIHQRIDINDLSERLNLSQSEGEKWIVNLIRDTKVDAKIDYKEGTVVMNHPPQSVYQQVIEKTKGGFFRTQVMNAAINKS